jgi:hypothetical protein
MHQADHKQISIVITGYGPKPCPISQTHLGGKLALMVAYFVYSRDLLNLRETVPHAHARRLQAWV